MGSGIVYVIRNKESGKEFVGSTTQELSRIWTAHKSWAKSGRRSFLHDDMRALGHQQFVIEELESVPVEEDLHMKQIEWIKRRKSAIPNGYNRVSGFTGFRVRFSIKTVRRIRALSYNHSQTHIAKKFHVSQPTISKIIAKKIYK